MNYKSLKIQIWFFFMDNASTHKNKILIKKYFLRRNAIIYNCPYSPELNPIEFAFNKVKNAFKSKPMSSDDIV